MPRILIGYDIHRSSRRRQALKTLRALTACYQKSFFDCELTADEATALFTELTEQLKPDEDGVIFAWLDPSQSNAPGQRWARGAQGIFLFN